MGYLSSTLTLDIAEQAEKTPTREFRRVPELDGLRGVAIGMVLLFHLFFMRIPSPQGSTLWYMLYPTRFGGAGVDLFFVLSGFLIGGILLDARNSANYFNAFYIRRVFRIVPLYYLVLLLYFVVAWVAQHFPDPVWVWPVQPVWYSFVFFAQNFWMAVFQSMGSAPLAVFWSLAVEEQFYLTLPWIVRLFERKRVSSIAIEVILLAPMLRLSIYVIWPNHPSAWFVLMPSRADSLFFGVLAAIILREHSWRSWLVQRRAILRLLVIVLAFGFPLFAHANVMVNGLLNICLVPSWIAALFFLVLFYSVTYENSRLSRCLRWRWLRYLGTIAYAAYLLHQVVAESTFYLLRRALPHLSTPMYVVGCSVALLVTLAFSGLSWKYFERPLVQRGHRFSY